MNVWVNKTNDNYLKLRLALKEFGAPIFSQEEFLGNQFDVWGFGREPNRIEIMNEVKGILFPDAFSESKIYKEGDLAIRYIHINHLLAAKKAAGRFKDKNDIEQLQKKNKL